MLKISKYAIDEKSKPLIIAEVGQSHLGSIKKTESIINKIAKSGVEFIKFQTHISNEESTLDEPFRIKISKFVDEEFLSRDSLAFREFFQDISPDIDLTYTYYGETDGEENEVTLPMTVQFFWPRA